MCRICGLRNHPTSKCPYSCKNDNCGRKGKHHRSECCYCTHKHSFDKCWYKSEEPCSICYLRNHLTDKCDKRCKSNDCDRIRPHHNSKCCFCEHSDHLSDDCWYKFSHACKHCGLHNHRSERCNDLCVFCNKHSRFIACKKIKT
jgi:hypothetical protein